MTEKELKWRKRMKRMIKTGAVILLVGIALLIAGIFAREYSVGFYGFGSAMVFVGVIFCIMALFYLKSKDSYKKAVAESDERNVILWGKAAAFAWPLTISIGITITGILTLFDIEAIPTIALNWVGLAGLFMHRITYWVMKNKY